MIIVVAFLLTVLSVPLCGGRLTRLAEIRIHRGWLIALALALQILVVNVVGASFPAALAAGIHLGSYALALAFVFANRRLPGIALLTLGGLANLVAIAANGGVMPASADALARAGKPLAIEEFTNSGVVADARLAFLGDVFALPEPWPLANVFSIGDVLLVLGGGVLVHAACGSRLRSPRRRASERQAFEAELESLRDGAGRMGGTTSAPETLARGDQPGHRARPGPTGEGGAAEVGGLRPVVPLRLLRGVGGEVSPIERGGLYWRSDEAGAVVVLSSAAWNRRNACLVVVPVVRTDPSVGPPPGALSLYAADSGLDTDAWVLTGRIGTIPVEAVAGLVRFVGTCVMTAIDAELDDMLGRSAVR